MLWLLIRSRGNSSEYPQHMFLWRNNKNYPLVILKYSPYLFYTVQSTLMLMIRIKESFLFPIEKNVYH